MASNIESSSAPVLTDIAESSMFSSAAIAGQEHQQPALVFYKIGADEPSAVNRLAAYLTGTAGMAHVELRFRTGESLSVFQDETVFLKKRGYSNAQYRAIAISVEPAAEQRMLNFAREQVGKGFNAWGLRRSPLPWPLFRSCDGSVDDGLWFCSELVTAALQVGGLLSDLVPERSSPNMLYSIAQAGVAGSRVSGLNAAIAPSRLALAEHEGVVVFGKKKQPRSKSTVVEVPDVENCLAKQHVRPPLPTLPSLRPV
jgi:hypothetical protein